MWLVHPRITKEAKVPLDSRKVHVRYKMVFYRIFEDKIVCQ